MKTPIKKATVNSEKYSMEHFDDAVCDVVNEFLPFCCTRAQHDVQPYSRAVRDPPLCTVWRI